MTAKPRTSRAQSVDPREPATVENRTKTGVSSRRIGQEAGLGQVGQILIDLKHAVRGSAARVDDALGNALVIEMGDLFAKMEVLHQRRAAYAGLQGVLIVGNLDALIPGHDLAGLDGVARQVGCLVGLAVEGLFVGGRGGLARGAGLRRPRATLARLGHTELPE